MYLVLVSAVGAYLQQQAHSAQIIAVRGILQTHPLRPVVSVNKFLLEI